MMLSGKESLKVLSSITGANLNSIDIISTARKIVINSCLCLRSLSATVTPDLEKSREKNEDGVMLSEKEKRAGEEEEVVVVDEDMEEKELPGLNHLLTWAASASPSNRLKLMRNVAELQANLLDIHMK